MHTRLLFVSGFIAAVACCGCTSEIEQLNKQHNAASQARLKQVSAALQKVAEQPAASAAYAEWLQAKRALDKNRLFAENERLKADLREVFQKQLPAAVKREAELYEKAALDDSHEVVFVDGGKQNAATLVLGENNALEPDPSFRSRNATYGYWLINGAPQKDVDKAKAWHNRLAGLKYLLVLRDIEIAKPEFKGPDGKGHNEFTRGAVQASAYLVELETQEVLTSFTIAVSNKGSPIGIAGYEMFLPSDPQAAVASLTSRLYDTAQDAAAASLAELSENVHAEYRHTRGGLLEMMERNN